MLTHPLQLGPLRVQGWSRAGEETWFRVQPPGVAFDVGRGAVQLAGVGDLFVSHGHLDHALGVPYVLSQRSLHHLKSSRVYCPQEILSPLRALIQAAERLEAVSYDYELIGLAPGARVELGKGFHVEAFRSDHVVPGLGYHLLRAKRRLAERFRGLEEAEISALARQGQDISEAVEEHLLSYCGDTGPGVFESEPRIFTAQSLILECTFLGQELRQLGSQYGHLHIEDLVRHADRFANRAIVLHHLSRRHTRAELVAAVEARLPQLEGRTYFVVEGS